MYNPIPDSDSEYNSCNEVLCPREKHCDSDCPGCEPTLPINRVPACKCAEVYPQYLPSGYCSQTWVRTRNFFQILLLAGYGTYLNFRTYAIEGRWLWYCTSHYRTCWRVQYVLGWRWDSEQTSQSVEYLCRYHHCSSSSDSSSIGRRGKIGERKQLSATESSKKSPMQKE